MKIELERFSPRSTAISAFDTSDPVINIARIVFCFENRGERPVQELFSEIFVEFQKEFPDTIKDFFYSLMEESLKKMLNK